MVKKLSHNRLPRNFHQSFKPERHYIAAMLRFAASGKEGNLQFIATETGIPTGTKSGKVPAILDYCRGMGLIQLTGEERSANKRPDLTSFGRAVFLEDPFLKTDITQWIAHLNLCSSQVGADIWYHTFFSGTPSLGFKFERSKLESYLGNYFGVGRTGLIGPMIGMYEDEAAFRICGALSEKSGIIIRKPAPIGEEYGYPYGAWILQLIFDNCTFARHPATARISIASSSTTNAL